MNTDGLCFDSKMFDFARIEFFSHFSHLKKKTSPVFEIHTKWNISFYQYERAFTYSYQYYLSTMN